MVVGERVGLALTWRKEGFGRSSIHIGSEGVDNGTSRILNLTSLDIQKVLLAACHPVAVALAGDWDSEAVDEGDVDACDGKIPSVGTALG